MKIRYPKLERETMLFQNETDKESKKKSLQKAVL